MGFDGIRRGRYRPQTKIDAGDLLEGVVWY